MAVRKTTTTTVTGPREYAVSKGKVVGTTQSRITITRSAPDYGKAIDLLRLPVFMLLFWLLVMAPFFTVMTTVSDGRVILAEEFTYSVIQSFEQLIPYNPDGDYVDGRYLYEDNGSIIGGGNPNTRFHSPKYNIINVLYVQDFTSLDVIGFWDSSDNYLGFYIRNASFVLDASRSYWTTKAKYLGDIDTSTNIILLPTNATKFAYGSAVTEPWTELQFYSVDPSYTISDPGLNRDYYQVMENARTAEYGNPFEFINFILQLPNLVGNAQPLRFIGIDASFADMNQQVLEIRASGYQGLLDLFKVLNPVRWFE